MTKTNLSTDILLVMNDIIRKPIDINVSFVNPRNFNSNGLTLDDILYALDLMPLHVDFEILKEKAQRARNLYEWDAYNKSALVLLKEMRLVVMLKLKESEVSEGQCRKFTDLYSHAGRTKTCAFVTSPKNDIVDVIMPPFTGWEYETESYLNRKVSYLYGEDAYVRIMPNSDYNEKMIFIADEYFDDKDVRFE